MDVLLDASPLSFMGRIVVAMLLGGLIGYQRQQHRHPAGLRTHMLVALGATLITLVSDSYVGPGQDASRVAAQIVSGIGFLGAGTIIRHGSNVRGLTTAASLWTVAGIGMASARGGVLLYLAVFATLLALITLTTVSLLEGRLWRDAARRDLVVVLIPSAMPLLMEALMEAGVVLYGVTRQAESASGTQVAYIRLRLPHHGQPDQVLKTAIRIEGVRAARWEAPGGMAQDEADTDEDDE